MPDSLVKFTTTKRSKLNAIPITNGQIIYLSDSSEIYFDMNGERKSTSDIIQMDKEEDILNCLTPINKLYLAKDTGKLWKYMNSDWVCISGSGEIADITLNGSRRGITKEGQTVNIDVLWSEF